jgi:Holliday junction resolvase RusA-like endonuclease
VRGEWRCTIIGEPAPAGSKRAFRNPHSGRVQVVDASAKTKPWQAQVASEAGERWVDGLLEGPLEVEVTFYRPRPRAHFGTGKNSMLIRHAAPVHPSTRPDVLKLARAVEDALTGVVWRDDAQIVTEVLRKRFGAPARCEVVVREAVEVDAMVTEVAA